MNTGVPGAESEPLHRQRRSRLNTENEKKEEPKDNAGGLGSPRQQKRADRGGSGETQPDGEVAFRSFAASQTPEA